MNYLDRLIKKAESIMEWTPSHAVDEVISALADAAGNPSNEKMLNMVEKLEIPPNARKRLKRELRDVPTGHLLPLAASLKILSLEEKKRLENGIEICWTGPIGEENPPRKTGAAIQELISKAEEEIVILGYSIRPDNPGVRNFMEAVKTRSKKRIRLSIIVDRFWQQEGFIEWLNDNPDMPWPIIYNREPPESDALSSMHAKCIIIDGRIMFVGSPNITRHGFTGNIELGVILSDPKVVKRAFSLVRGLMRELNDAKISRDQVFAKARHHQ